MTQELPIFLTTRGFSPILITGLWYVYTKHYITGFLLNFSYGSYVALMKSLMKKQNPKSLKHKKHCEHESSVSFSEDESLSKNKLQTKDGEPLQDDFIDSSSHTESCKSSGASYESEKGVINSRSQSQPSELEAFLSLLLKYFPSLNKTSRNHETFRETILSFWKVLSKIIKESNNTGRFLGYWTILYHVFIRVLHRKDSSSVSSFSVGIASFLSGFLVQFIYNGVSWKIALYCLLRSLMGLTRMRKEFSTKIIETTSQNIDQSITNQASELVGDVISNGVETTAKSHLTLADGLVAGAGALGAFGIISKLTQGIGRKAITHPKSTSIISSMFNALTNKATLSYVLVNIGIGYNLYYYPDFMDVAYQNFLGSMACIYRYTTKDIIDINMVETRPCHPYHPPIKSCWDSLWNRSFSIVYKVFKVYASVHLFALLLSGQLWKRTKQPFLAYYGKLAKNFFVGVSRSCLFLSTQLLICGPSPCIHNYLANTFNNGKHSRFLMILPWMIGSFSIAFEAASRRSELALYSLWRLAICYVYRWRNTHSNQEHDPMFEKIFSALVFGFATCFWIIVKNRDSSYLKRLDRMILSHVFPPHLEMKI